MKHGFNRDSNYRISIFYINACTDCINMAPKTKNAAVKKTKTKKVKDPNAPKRAKSAYFFFMDDIREKTKAANPDAKIAELGKIMGAEWNKIKETPEADKYRKQAENDKIRYEKAMKEYKA